MARYKRQVRIEDWEGNEYILSGSSGGSSGAIIQSEDIDGRDSITNGNANYTDNNTSSGKSIFIVGSTSNKTLLNTKIEDLKCGKYSIIFRMRCNNNTVTTKLIQINVYHNDGTRDTLMSTTYLSPSNFKAANVYQTFGFVTELKGILNTTTKATNMKIIITVLGNSTSYQYWLDYLSVNMTYVGIGGAPTTLK